MTKLDKKIENINNINNNKMRMYKRWCNEFTEYLYILHNVLPNEKVKQMLLDFESDKEEIERGSS